MNEHKSLDVCCNSQHQNQRTIILLPEKHAVVVDTKHRSLNLNSVNQLIFVMVKCGVLFEVRAEFLNNI
jgi:hypothetical protein